MALNLSTLTSPSTSDDVLSDIYTTADQGDGIALMDDLSPNSIDATQTTANNQPIAFVNSADGTFARFDCSDDRMSFTLASPITNGTVFFATKKGSYAAYLNLLAGTHDFSGNKISPSYQFENDLVALYLFEYQLTEAQIAQLKSYFVAKGAVADYGAVDSLAFAWAQFSGLTRLFPIDTSSATILSLAFYNLSNLADFPVIDTSSVTRFFRSWRGCSGIVSFPFIVTSLGTSFLEAWRDCSKLKHFAAQMFDNWNPVSIDSGVFNDTWKNCTSLTPQSVENILTSIDTSGKHATRNGASGGTALGDPVIDIDYDSSGLTAATTTAITNLKDKGWGININGTLQ